MTIDSTEVRLAPFGNVYVAPVGTALPSTATQPLNVAFKALGYVDRDGVSISPNIELSDIMAWQSAVPVKTTVDTVSLELSFVMLQTNRATWEVFWFNETFTNNFGEAALTISSNPPSQEAAVIIEWTDDEEDQTRLIVPRAIVAQRETLQLVRTDAAKAGVTVRCLDYSGTLAYIRSENTDLTPST
jgi:hypothetical protein